MKRLLALVLLLALVGAAQATSLNFQNPNDFTSITKLSLSANQNSTSWSESSTGGNNYITVGVYANGDTSVFILNNPSQSTYASATLLGMPTLSSGVAIALLDSNKNILYLFKENHNSAPARYEVKISGGTSYFYRDGAIIGNSTPISQNPSYIGFGLYQSFGSNAWHYSSWDDYVYSQTENKNILGISESDDNMFVITQDIINGASDGLTFGVNGTQVQSTYMPMTWARGDLSTPLTNQSIQLVSYPSNTVYAQYYTGTDTFAGSINVDIKTYLIDANAPDGYYAMYMPGTGAYSNIIMKKSNGATVSFNKDSYSTGDTATVITYVANGGYWDTSSYQYHLSLYGLTSGYVENYTITSQSGSFTHAWESIDTPGVYYALLYATSRSTGKESILGLDWATLSSYAGYGGLVVNAQNGIPIDGAFVNMTQDGVSGNSTSGFDGNWSTGPVFNTGAILTINASATGYIPYNYSWTPLAARTVTGLNISMVPSDPTYTGLAIGGVDRDSLYGRPIEGATVTVRNTTTGLYCYKTTSFTGWYLNDETDCLFESKTPYDVWAYKIGYTNSTTGKAVTK